tara:strand:+ start:398 stop:574 length:177 start_codon:yes stop_codon:yes gene_type:complete
MKKRERAVEGTPVEKKRQCPGQIVNNIHNHAQTININIHNHAPPFVEKKGPQPEKSAL